MRQMAFVFTAVAALAIAGCATMNVSAHIERAVTGTPDPLIHYHASVGR